MTDKRVRIDRRRVAFQPLRVGGKAVKCPERLVAYKIERGRRPRTHTNRGQRNPTVTDHDCRYALRHLAQHAARTTQYRSIVVRVCVDEPWRDGLIGCDHLAVTGDRTKISDRHDTVTAYRDIGPEPGCPGAIENNSISDHQITTRHLHGLSKGFYGRPRLAEKFLLSARTSNRGSSPDGWLAPKGICRDPIRYAVR